MGSSDAPFYGVFAEKYESVLVPSRFGPPARDLITTVDRLSGNQKLLDIGTGTGIVLDRCVEAQLPGLAVGIDPSAEMLAVAKSKGHNCLVTGGTPGLPFADGEFDAVVASFVLSHTHCVDASLSDMVRVLTQGGCLAISSWGKADDMYRSLWMDTVRKYMNVDELNELAGRAVPNEEALEAPGRLKMNLERNGLKDVQVRLKSYDKSETALAFVTVRSSMAPSRIMEKIIGPDQWRIFIHEVLNRLTAKFCEPLTYSVTVNLAHGIKV